MITVAVLGTIEARRDGVRLDLPHGKTAELLARLALSCGALVRTDALLEDLWAEPTARNTLQSKVSQLRRTLGPDVVVGSPDGYLLAVQADAVDALRAAELAATAAAAAAAGDPAAALRSATAGLALFTGEPLVTAGDWAAPHRARLAELRLQLGEEAIAARVALGAGSDVVAELTELVERHPLRERLWVALITAYYRAGRQAEALAAYGRVRRLLRDELGVDAGPELRDLELRVLRHSADLTRGAPRPTAQPGNVPPLDSPTVGRVADVAAVRTALDEHRLVTVLGAGGVGKTRLAIEVAAALSQPGGTWVVRLDEAEPGAPLAQLVAETMVVSGGASGLGPRLSGAPTVVLLDNCEHVLAEAAALVASLLAVAPRLAVLATSQAPLGLAAEHRYYLEPLNQRDSVELFTRRAREVRARLVLDPAAMTLVERACRSLDGLPLAIELAASRVRSLSLSDLARRLDDRFAVLRDPSSSEPDRRRALEGAIAWSYDLLFPDDRAGLLALSCFSGSATLDALEQVLVALGVPPTAVLDTLGRLVDRSLVVLDESTPTSPRYRLLDAVRAFALDRLRESGQAARAAAAHAAWYAATADWCDRHVRSERQADCLAIARAERANVDAALAWCARHDQRLGLRIAGGFGWTWAVLGDGTAGAARIRAAIVAAAPVRERVEAYLLAGWLEASAGSVALAEGDLDQARKLARTLGDEVLLADVDRHQAFLAIQQGRPAEVRGRATAAVGVYRARGLAWPLAAGLLLDAYGALMLGDTVTARQEATEAVGILTPIGDSWGLIHGRAMLGAVAQAEHRLDDAATELEEAAEQSVVLGFVGQAGLHRATLARVQQRAGDPAAEPTYRRAIAEATSSGDGRLAATARLNLARLQRSSGQDADAVALLRENAQWYEAAGGGDFALHTAGLLAALQDDFDGLDQVLDQARSERNAEVQVLALDGLARLAASRGDLVVGAARLAEADGLAPLVGYTLDEADRVDARLARALLAR